MLKTFVIADTDKSRDPILGTVRVDTQDITSVIPVRDAIPGYAQSIIHLVNGAVIPVQESTKNLQLNLQEDARVVRIVERIVGTDSDGHYRHFENQTFYIDLDKVPGFKLTNDFEYGYVSHILDRIASRMQEGKFNCELEGTSRKYSFSDMSREYGILAPDVRPKVLIGVFDYEVDI